MLPRGGWKACASPYLMLPLDGRTKLHTKKANAASGCKNCQSQEISTLYSCQPWLRTAISSNNVITDNGRSDEEPHRA